MTSPIYLVQISAYQGQNECEYACTFTRNALIKETSEQGLICDIIEQAPMNETQILKSVLLHVQGKKSESFLSHWQRSVLWQFKSPLRSHHKRKNKMKFSIFQINNYLSLLE